MRYTVQHTEGRWQTSSMPLAQLTGCLTCCGWSEVYTGHQAPSWPASTFVAQTFKGSRISANNLFSQV